MRGTTRPSLRWDAANWPARKIMTKWREIRNRYRRQVDGHRLLEAKNVTWLLNRDLARYHPSCDKFQVQFHLPVRPAKIEDRLSRCSVLNLLNRKSSIPHARFCRANLVMAADRADKRGVDRIGSGHLPCSARSSADENSANDSNAAFAVSTRSDIRDVPTRNSKIRYRR